MDLETHFTEQMKSLGWETDEKGFSHYCGAKIVRAARVKGWRAYTVSGVSKAIFPEPQSASDWLVAEDSGFWSIGIWGSRGVIAGIFLLTGSCISGHDEVLTAWSAWEGDALPAQYTTAFKRLFLRKATCLNCGKSSVDDIHLSRFVFERREAYFVVCTSGRPVWRLKFTDVCEGDNGLARAEHTWNRKIRLSEAGGKHTVKEIQQIRSLQQNRCIYCNAVFTDSLRATKDHLIPVNYGGADWALNIVLACRSCNARRSDVPFRTYCKLLSKTQNQRIILHLGRRMLDLETDKIPKDAFECFCVGIALHHPKNFRYQLILKMSAKARRNAVSNRLLPIHAHLILKSALAMKRL